MADWAAADSADAIAALGRGQERDRFGDLTGTPDDRNTAAVELVTAMIRGYTRGNGFNAEGVPAPDLRAVIVTATLRLLSNPNGLAYEQGSSGSRHYGTGDNVGLTLLERQVCDRYRVTAM